MSAVDVLLAFCELAGAKIPEGYVTDGMSQVAVFKGEANFDADQAATLEDGRRCHAARKAGRQK